MVQSSKFTWNDPDAIIRKHVIIHFIKWHNIERVQNSEIVLATEGFKQKLVQWHLTTRERLVWTNSRTVSMIKSWGVSCLIKALMLTKAQYLLPSIWNEHIIYLNLVRIKIKKKFGFPSCGLEKSDRYVFVLKSSQGLVCFNTLRWLVWSI